MLVKEVIQENAAWHIDDIENATGRILKLYSQVFDALDSTGWERATEAAMNSLRGHEYVIAALNPSGFNLLFVGPRYTSENDANRILWNILEPRIELVDQKHGLLPSRDRNRVYHASDEIVEEVMDTFKLEVLYEPLRFVFPKAEFAELKFSTRLLIQRN